MLSAPNISADVTPAVGFYTLSQISLFSLIILRFTRPSSGPLRRQCASLARVEEGHAISFSNYLLVMIN